ncbi:SAC3/GANP/THP3 like protein, partial [Aduncisulcus paluster]
MYRMCQREEALQREKNNDLSYFEYFSSEGHPLHDPYRVMKKYKRSEAGFRQDSKSVLTLDQLEYSLGYLISEILEYTRRPMKDVFPFAEDRLHAIGLDLASHVHSKSGSIHHSSINPQSIEGLMFLTRACSCLELVVRTYIVLTFRAQLVFDPEKETWLHIMLTHKHLCACLDPLLAGYQKIFKHKEQRNHNVFKTTLHRTETLSLALLLRLNQKRNLSALLSLFDRASLSSPPVAAALQAVMYIDSHDLYSLVNLIHKFKFSVPACCLLEPAVTRLRASMVWSIGSIQDRMKKSQEPPNTQSLPFYPHLLKADTLSRLLMLNPLPYGHPHISCREEGGCDLVKPKYGAENDPASCPSSHASLFLDLYGIFEKVFDPSTSHQSISKYYPKSHVYAVTNENGRCVFPSLEACASMKQAISLSFKEDSPPPRLDVLDSLLSHTAFSPESLKALAMSLHSKITSDTLGGKKIVLTKPKEHTRSMHSSISFCFYHLQYNQKKRSGQGQPAHQSAGDHSHCGMVNVISKFNTFSKQEEFSQVSWRGENAKIPKFIRCISLNLKSIPDRIQKFTEFQGEKKGNDEESSSYSPDIEIEKELKEYERKDNLSKPPKYESLGQKNNIRSPSTSISVTDSKRGMGLFGVIPQDSDPTHSIFSSVVSDGASSSMFGSIFGTETEKEEKSTTSQSFTNSDTEYSRIFPSSSASAVIPQPTNDST